MNLLGAGALVVATALLVVAILGGAVPLTVVRRRARHAEPTPRARLRTYLECVLVLVLSSAMVVLGVGLVLNYQNGWYTSWHDVFGMNRTTAPTVKQNVTVTKVLASRPPVVHTVVAQYPALPEPGQLVQTFHVPFPGSRETGTVLAALPADYSSPAMSQHLYPVIVAYHGMPGNPWQWLDGMNIRPAEAQLESAHVLGEVITIVPQVEAPHGEDTECIFGPSGPTQMEDWLSTTVPQFVEQHLRVIKNRDAWATIGFSAGGWCAAMLTMLHPQTFAVAMIMAGYFRPWWAIDPPWSLKSATNERYDLVKLAGTDPPRVAMWVESSTKDSESGWRTEEFVKAVATAKQPLSLTTVMETTGGHRASEWLARLPMALTWLAQNVPAFKA